MASDPLQPAHLFGHVEDARSFHVPRALAEHGHIDIPQPFLLETPVAGFDFAITKFMVIEVIVAVITCVVFIGLARQMATGVKPRGKLWNLLETFLIFLRDEVAVPCIGSHDAKRFMPLLWTLFFFVLGCNLLGMIPWMGSPTGALAVTATLALVTFVTVLGAGMSKLGVIGFFKAQVPGMDLPFAVAVLLVPMIFVIEILGLLIKHGVLAVRLLANMMAGHVVLAVIVAFIAASANAGFFLSNTVTIASVAGATALSLLELFVAFLQAYIFTFLSALFIGSAVHPH